MCIHFRQIKSQYIKAFFGLQNQVLGSRPVSIPFLLLVSEHNGEIGITFCRTACVEIRASSEGSWYYISMDAYNPVES